MRYTVEPGLYALGRPDQNARVLVTSNYKMSFDRLRESLPGRDLWILVLDTMGINVWCAAGKGTFGTEELARRVEAAGLPHIVSHRELILPQLAAPGIAAHLVKKISGFKVVYGPIRSKDLPAFLDNGFKATPEMRRKTFPLVERAALIPMELVAALKVMVFVLPAAFLLGGLVGRTGAFWSRATHEGLFAAVALLAAVLAGAVLTPLLLPWLPGRAFSTKGFSVGLVTALVLVFLRTQETVSSAWMLGLSGWLFLIPALSAFLAMNFTGASTYTSLSGVKKEMRWAVPMEIGAGVVGLGLWVGARFMT
jgi:hypothetical protein